VTKHMRPRTRPNYSRPRQLQIGLETKPRDLTSLYELYKNNYSYAFHWCAAAVPLPGILIITEIPTRGHPQSEKCMTLF